MCVFSVCVCLSLSFVVNDYLSKSHFVWLQARENNDRRKSRDESALEAESTTFRASASKGDTIIQHLRSQTACQRDAWKVALDASREYFGEVQTKFSTGEEEA